MFVVINKNDTSIHTLCRMIWESTAYMKGQD